MVCLKMSFTYSSLLLLLLVFSVFIGGARTDFISDLACNLTNCGQGTCVPASGPFLPFDCVCKPGWKKIQIGSITLPSCTIPNCTVDFDCGGQSPVSPPPPASLLPPLPNVTDPCGFAFCGDGKCVPNGPSFTCQCNPGSANLLNLTGLACFQECSFGADCNGLGFEPASPPPPSTSSSPGGNDVPNSSRVLQSLTALLLVGIFLSFF